MSTPSKTFARVMACITSALVVVAACDGGCSPDPVEEAGRVGVVSPRDRVELTRIWPNDAGPFPAQDPPYVAALAALAPSAPIPMEEPPAKPKPSPKATEIDALVIPDGNTPAPTSAEWMAAPSLHTTHPHCRARLVREWMTILCTTTPTSFREPLGVVRVLAGDASEVQQWTHEGKPDAEGFFPPRTSAAIFPVRRGDRRLLEILYVAHGAHPRFDQLDAYTVSVAWLEGMKSPDITVTE